MGKYDAEEVIVRMRVLDEIKESYYDALDKADGLPINLYLEDVVRNIDVFEEDSVVLAIKWVLKQANFCIELRDRFPDSAKALLGLEGMLRYVVARLKQYLEKYYNISAKFTPELKIVFTFPDGRKD